MDAFSVLVDDPAVLASHWEKAPFVATGLPRLDDVFSFAEAERLIGSGTLPLPCIRLFNAGADVPVAGLGLRAERKAASRERRVDGAAVLREVAAGATLVLEELQTYCPSVAALSRALAAETGFRPYTAAFITPASSRGVAPHYDTASVFIRQFHGSKLWRVAHPPQRWPSREWSRGEDLDTEVALETELTEGQCLYVPRGFVHSGVATASASAHLSVGLAAPTWAMVLRRLADAALDDEALREALPRGFHLMPPAELRAMLADRAALLAARLGPLAAGPPADAAFAALRPAPGRDPLPPGSLAAALARSDPRSDPRLDP